MKDPPGSVRASGVEALATQHQELEQTRSALEGFTDVASARRAGFVLSNPGTPGSCLPEHLIDWSRMDETLELDRPEMLLAAGGRDEDAIIAASYYVVGTRPPSGFSGSEDRWHQHGGMCVDPDGQGREVDRLTCTGARYVEAGWMVHVWADPAHPNPVGMFEITYPGFRTQG